MSGNDWKYYSLRPKVMSSIIKFYEKVPNLIDFNLRGEISHRFPQMLTAYDKLKFSAPLLSMQNNGPMR